MKGVKDLYRKAGYGIRFMGRSAAKIGEKIIQISEDDSWRRLLLMIELLGMMSNSEEYELLSSHGFKEASKFANYEKISDIFNYMITHFSQDVSLEEVARHAT